MTYIYRFMALSGQEHRLFVEAVLWLSLCQLALLLPFRWIAPYIGARMKQASDTNLPSRMHTLASEISQAINRAAHNIPWNAKCLVQAMVGKFMLRSRKVESTL